MNNRAEQDVTKNPQSALIEYIKLRTELLTLAQRANSLKKKLDAGVENARTFEEIGALKAVEQEYERAKANLEEVGEAYPDKVKMLRASMTADELTAMDIYNKHHANGQQTSMRNKVGLFDTNAASLSVADQDDQHVVTETNTATCRTP